MEEKMMEKKQLSALLDGLKKSLSNEDMQNLLAAIVQEQTEKKENEKQGEEGRTNFSDGPNMYVGDAWIANDTGIYYDDGKHTPINISGTPVLITASVASLDEKRKRYQMAYKDEDSGKWEYAIEEAETLISPRKVIELANLGISLSGRTAGLMCDYFKSIIDESRKNGAMKCIIASSKLGWHKGRFLPYDCKELVFDGDEGFPHIIDALKEHGDREKWYEEFKKLRGRDAVDFMTAGVLAAPLIKLIGFDGFVCDLYGKSGTGKSVTNRIVATIWGDDATLVSAGKTTLTASEGRMSVLNNLPYIMEDMNNISERARGEYIQGLVMQMSNGIGKARGKKDGGTQTIKTWNTTAVLTSEFNITNQFKNAGSINRVIACNIGSLIYSQEELNRLPKFFRKNSGFAGRDFIKAIEKLGEEKVEKIYDEFNEKIRKKAAEKGKSDRQATALAYMMTADKIATDYVFQDGKYIDIEKAIDWLADDDKVDTSARFYTTLIETINANGQHFEGMTFDEGDIKEAQDNNRTIRMNTEYWGRYDAERGYVYVLPFFLKELAKKEEVDLGLFYDYCIENGLMQKAKDGGKATTYHSLVLLGAKGLHKSVKGWKIKLPQEGDTEEADMTPFERADAELVRIEEAKGTNNKAILDFPFKN